MSGEAGWASVAMMRRSSAPCASSSWHVPVSASSTIAACSLSGAFRLARLNSVQNSFASMLLSDTNFVKWSFFLVPPTNTRSSAG